MAWMLSHVSSKTIVAAAVIFSLTIAIYIVYVDELRGAKDNNELRILCFGDSITAGHTGKYGGDGKAIYHPYSLTLRKRLKTQGLKRKLTRKIIVHNRGLNGEKASKSMESRLPRLLKLRYYDWVIILGGTNDFRSLLENNSPVNGKYGRKLYQPILNSLLSLHRTVHKRGGRTVAVTIPGRQCELSNNCRGLKAVRLWVNEKLRKFAAKFKGKVVLADLAKDMRIGRYLKYWSDEVHFTPLGYDVIGNVIYNVLQGSL